jgi:hypothetical protein
VTEHTPLGANKQAGRNAAKGSEPYYDVARNQWVRQCPHGDVCTGCDAVGRCTRASRPEFPQLRSALAGDEVALAALARLEAAFADDGVLAEVVDAYGRRWSKDGTYYAAVEELRSGPSVLGVCPHGVDLDHEFCPKGCRV